MAASRCATEPSLAAPRRVLESLEQQKQILAIEAQTVIDAAGGRL